MKIGTDGVLLGAWAPIRGAGRILDVGTGCGIIALMLAQRTADIGSSISAIDVDNNAAGQSLENFKASPWPDRLPKHNAGVHRSLAQFVADRDPGFVDLIVCNPPFFSSPGSLPKSSRQVARHALLDDQHQMFVEMNELLNKESGRLCVVLPFEQADSIVRKCRMLGLNLQSRLDVRPTPQSDPKRALLEFTKASIATADCNHDELVVEVARHQYSEDYADLTREFHLRYLDE